MSMDTQILKERLEEKIKLFDSKDHNEESERDVCRVYIEPLFGFLGWNIADTNEVKEQKNQPQGKPDYIFYINGSIAFFVEAKKIKPITEDDIKQALNYARNRSKRWAVLTNFEETIILICDTKETSLLKHIFKHISYKDLVKNLDDLLLLSRESFETGMIDKKAEEDGRTKKTIKIDEQLLNDILSWRRKIIHSIEKHNSKKYSKDILEEIAQTLLNRIIFIRTAEDRKLEAQPDETLREILNQYENNKYIVIKNKINKLFKEYDKIYDSKLFTYDEKDFNVRHICETVNIDNDTYYKILRETYDKDEIYEYKFNEIDANVLGSMYEKYIGAIHLFRKKQGIYYTPTYVVNYIVKNTIGEEIEAKKLKDVEGIKILDMACGSGSFLLGAFDFLDDYYKHKDKNYAQAGLDTEKERTARLTRKTKILKNNLYGVDLDNKAVEISQLNLLLKIAETRDRLPDLKNNIQHGNSLIDDGNTSTYEHLFPEIKNTFDIIIGNPPWVQSKFLPEGEKEYFSKNYSTAKRQYDLFTLFIEKGLRLLKEGGMLGFIIPDRFIVNSDYQVFRKFLLDNTRIKQIVQVGEGVFAGVDMPSAIIILEKCNSENERNRNIIEVRLSIKSAIQKVKQSDFNKNEGFVFSIFNNSEFKTIIQKIEKGSKRLSEFVENGRGVEIGKKSDTVSDTNGDVRFLIGSDMDRYQIKGYHYLKLGNKDINYKDPELYKGEKILVRKTGLGINAVLDKNNYVIQVIYIFRAKNADSNLRYILGILNSKLMNFYYFSKFGQKDRKVFPHLTQGKVLQLPIKYVRENEKTLVNKVEEILTLYHKFNELGDNSNEKRELKDEIDRTNREIDEIVYKVYNITPEEQSIIGESMKKI